MAMLDSPIRAAQYLRMSTEHQHYSLHHQRLAIAAYAALHGYEVVRTYEDAGVSGLRLQNREGLKRLLADVVGGAVDFSTILTYDVSRWGRFQDPDQSAHYEFICREAGVNIEYCAEPFDNDGSLMATLVKQLKRAMAAEYSRELSAKIKAAQWNLASLGFWQGGPPGFALRRRIVHADGTLGAVLQPGERKHHASDRVVLALGPRPELATVQRIFRLFVIAGMSRAEVSRTLNAEGAEAEDGALWSPSRVNQVLSNEKYAGFQIFGKTTGILTRNRKRGPPETRVRIRCRYRPIVSRQMFNLAQRNMATRFRQMSDEAMLRGLEGLLREHGRLSGKLIDEAELLPCSELYRRRFGGLISAYRRVGFDANQWAVRASQIDRRGTECRRRNKPVAPTPDEMLVRLRRLHEEVGYLSTTILRDSPQVPGSHAYRRVFGSMRRAYDLVGYSPTVKQKLAMVQREQGPR